MSNPVLHYDFTLNASVLPQYEVVVETFRGLCRAWCFQSESGELNHRTHYQGRVTLKEKMRQSTFVNKLVGTCLEGCHLSPTSTANMGNTFYVMKDAGRVAGPWCDKDVVQVVPYRFRNWVPRPWQAKVLEIGRAVSDRTVNVIYDEVGNIGKSSVCGYMATHGLARLMPVMKDPRDLMRVAMSGREHACYLIDLARAIDKSRLVGMWVAVEDLKNGHVYDDRYEYKEKWFLDPPTVIVFTNKIPDMSLMSRDRWAIWQVQDDDLVPY